MSEFTSTMAQMIASARTPQAQGGGTQRYFGSSGSGGGIKGKRTSTSASVGIDADEAKRVFGFMSPEQKQEAFKQMQINYERMVAEDPEKAELWRKSKVVQKLNSKLAAGGFPLTQRSDGTWDIPIRSPEQRAYDDPNFSLDRAKSGMYQDKNTDALYQFNTQRKIGKQTTQPPLSGGRVKDSSHQSFWERGNKSPEQAGMAGMVGDDLGIEDEYAGVAFEDLPLHEKARRASAPYKDASDRLMERQQMQINMLMQKNYANQIKLDIQKSKENTLVTQKQIALANLEIDKLHREMAPGYIDDVAKQQMDNISHRYNAALQRNSDIRTQLGAEADKFKGQLSLTKNMLDATESAVNESSVWVEDVFKRVWEDPTVDPKVASEMRQKATGYTAGFMGPLTTAISEIMDFKPTDVETYFGPDALKLFPYTKTTPGSEENITNFQLEMAGIIGKYGQLLKKIKSNREIDEPYYEAYAAWISDGRIGFTDSEVQAALRGMGLHEGYIQDLMTRNERQYFDTNQVQQQPVPQQQAPQKSKQQEPAKKKQAPTRTYGRSEFLIKKPSKERKKVEEPERNKGRGAAIKKALDPYIGYDSPLLKR